MFHYLFTNDLRISSLESFLKDAGHKFITNTVPTAAENKSANNNLKTLGFYFNLSEDSNCAKIAAQGDVRTVVLNFIEKFQFPNLRTKESFDNAREDNIKLAPMRLIVKLLFVMQMSEGRLAYLTKNEILNFIFYNEAVAKVKNPDVLSLYSEIKKFREDGVYPESVIQVNEYRNWKHEERQLREMVKILTWSGFVVEKDNGLSIHYDELSEVHKAEIFDIINSLEYWEGTTLESYREYMDVKQKRTDEEVHITTEAPRLKGGMNILLYGVPGSGKSHIIEKEYCDDEARMERVVFHPDYTYSDFVGQILPSVKDGIVKYEYSPGPFTKILKKAYENQTKQYYLIVEEINRGNAPAIFGEVFQLLDRDDDGSSKYSVTNSDISEKVYNDSEKHVRLLSNMNIIATMNTSDQNVFTLDTAFQRRWKMKLIENDVDRAEHADDVILDTGVKWKHFNKVINTQILNNSIGISSSEDKRLGAYFAERSDLAFNADEDNEELEDRSRRKAKQQNRQFPEKIIKYLWDDAFKFDRTSIFGNEFKCLEDVIKKFNNNRGNDRYAIFNKDIRDQLKI